MDKLNRIAVLLAGDFRQWPQAAEYIFAFAERQAITVDYYFATWTTTQDFWFTQNIKIQQRSITENDITCEFIKHNKNLINFQLVDQITQSNTILHCSDSTFYYQTYLAKLASIMKRRHELDNNFVYDQVFEIRPDLYIVDDVNSPITLADFEWLGELSYNNHQPNLSRSQWPLAPDVYYQTNSFSNDIMAERFYYKKSTHYSQTQIDCNGQLTFVNNHWILFDYIHLRRIRPVALAQPIIQVVIRPNFPQDDLRNYSQEQLREYFIQYSNLVHHM